MNLDKLKAAFAEGLELPIESITDDLSYNAVPQWDSFAHMVIIAAIEQAFDILIETDDLINMSSFLKAKEIVAKYGVVL
jgi:acyl carrier protein